MIRSFINKLRDPDENLLFQLTKLASIVPLAFGFLFFIFGLIVLLIGKQTVVGSAWVKFLNLASRPLLYLALILILGSAIVFQLLKLYVRVKIKKNEGVRQ